MENVLRPIYQERASQPDTLGIILIEKNKNVLPVTDTFDSVLLVITKGISQPMSIKHYEYEDKKVSLYTVTDSKLKEWLLLGTNRRVFEWVINGLIVFDRNEYATNLKEQLISFPIKDRSFKIGLEFAKLIRRYQEGKAFFESKHYLDAYNNVLHALHHLARLAVIEEGIHPEVTVWNQVRHIEPHIFMLYKEVVESDETLEKRLELLFLASDFLIHSRAKQGGKHLIEILATREEPWSISEIMGHPDLSAYSIDLEIMLAFLVEKQIVHVAKIETKGRGLFHRKYYVEVR
jgi:hypothetical protein